MITKIANTIYPLLPVWFQNLGISAYGYYWKRRRFGGFFREEYKRFKDREIFTHLQWRDYQTVELRKLLVHVFETVPYYREKYGKLGFTFNHFRRFELDDLHKLPFLEKEDLRKYGTSSLLSSKRERGGGFFSSSGSTGTPVQILYSLRFHQVIQAAYESRVRNWANVDRFMPRGMIGGRRVVTDVIGAEPYYRFNAFEKQTYFSSYHISEENALSYLEGIKRNNVEYMVGQATSNYLLARFFEVLNLSVPKLRAVITTSEKLEPFMRETIERVYQCRVFDSYSGVENCGLISQADDGALFSSPDVGILELIDKEKTDGNVYDSELVCTGLLNFDQPLIRYRIGDRVKVPVTRTSSFCEMPEIFEISGRSEDIIRTKDGRCMIRFDKLFINLPFLIEAQLIQHNYEDYTIKVVAEHPVSINEQEVLRERVWKQIGYGIKVNIIQVEKIERGPNGKFRAVISEMPFR